MRRRRSSVHISLVLIGSALVSLLDMLIWAALALAVQLIAFLGVRLAVPAIGQHVREGQVSSGVLLGAVAIALGILNAASITY